MEDPGIDDLFRVGTIARILKLLRMPDGTTTAILQGRKRFELEDLVSDEPYMLATVRTLEYEPVMIRWSSMRLFLPFWNARSKS